VADLLTGQKVHNLSAHLDLMHRSHRHHRPLRLIPAHCTHHTNSNSNINRPISTIRQATIFSVPNKTCINRPSMMAAITKDSPPQTKDNLKVSRRRRTVNGFHHLMVVLSRQITRAPTNHPDKAIM